ncbi:MAG TPA: hypothetical protein H9875_08160 [Candidatus Levilactobacillus faecigallinarum]|uniref:Uncharacterized protein n=1 Tax=Candidatus Levilactobacillus faecigallinarum TaxID=2838638 RepID=A0A9D1U5L9_9LACO|nr:hypothetical protein [Candidatus Levilactobacillus faecigallinarum]
MTKVPHTPKKTLTPEQRDRVAKIARWMQTLNDQQVSDLMQADDATSKPKTQPKGD